MRVPPSPGVTSSIRPLKEVQGRRLDKLHQAKDPALRDEVSRMLARAQTGDLAELQVIVPILQSIASDNSVAQTIRTQINAVLKIASTTS